jgi:hypothetical protein
MPAKVELSFIEYTGSAILVCGRPEEADIMTFPIAFDGFLCLLTR